jgi:hypothetical protein
MTAEFENQNQNQEAIDFYEKHYKIVREWFLVPGEKQFLGEKNSRKCRFCDRSEPQVTFRKIAHSIPESLGNKSLFSYYECDECNENFGKGIESDFGEWSKPIRAMTRIKGKNGVPRLVKKGEKRWRLEADKTGDLRIEMMEAAPIFSVDEEKKEITFNLTRGNYTPVAVLKTFMKIGLTLLPQIHMYYFAMLREWVKDPNHNNGSIKIPVMYTFQPGPLPNDKLTAMLLIRKADYLVVPYAYLIIAYGNEMYQIHLPSSREASSASYTLPFFPYAPSALFAPTYGNSRKALLDLSGTEKVKEVAYSFTAHYDEFSEMTTANNPDEIDNS